MIKYSISFLSLLLIFITGCSKDDPNPGSTPDPDPESEELTSEEVTSFLINNSESVEEEGKVWRISDATINNESGSTSISNLPNVQNSFLNRMDQRME